MKQGFTMIEMLIVIGIAGLLLAITVPTLTGSNIEAKQLKQGASLIQDQIRYAKTLAITRNIETEIRFYRLPNEAFRHLQIFLQQEDFTFKAQDKIRSLKNNIVISEATSQGDPVSSLASNSKIFKSNLIKALSKSQIPEYFALRFHPNRKIIQFLSNEKETPLQENQQWTITLIKQKKNNSTENKLPNNFITISINPDTAETQQYSLGK